MTITTLPPSTTFRTAPLMEAPQGVDRENNRILGAAILQLGPLNDGDARPWVNDELTAQQVVDYGNANNIGTKARFTHPSMSSDGLGKYLGRWSNFRLDGDTVRADLQVAESAFRSPQGDLGSYVLDLAEEDPDSFGNSISFKPDWDAMDDTETDDGLQMVRLSGLKAVDVVDEPAATSGLFSREGDARDLPAMAVRLLDEHFAGAPADVISGRVNGLLKRYFRSRGLTMTTENEPVTTDEKPGTAPAEPVETDGSLSSDDNARQDLATRREEIAALCRIAGCPDQAGDFAAAGMSRAEVQQYLRDSGHLQKTRPLVPDEQADSPEPPDENEQFRKEYKEHVSACRKYGKTPVAEDQFIRSRRIDAGLEPLVPAGQN